MARNQSHFQLRRDTNENWLKANPILKSGEPGFVTDTGALKIGNGKDTFSALAEIAGGDPGQGGGSTGAGDIVVLNMEYAPAEEEGKMLIYCDIDKDELVGYMQDDKAFIGYLNMSEGNSVSKLIIDILEFGFNDEFMGINGVLRGADNHDMYMNFEYNDETSRLEATIDAEPERKPEVYVARINEEDSDPLALTNSQGNKIKNTLRNGGIAFINIINSRAVSQLQVIGYEERDNTNEIYVFEGETITFTWDANTQTYIHND